MRDRHREEQGTALVLSLFLVIIVSGLVVTGTLTSRAHKTEVATNHARYALAKQFARSGLTEAIGWFRKQTAQPVLTFEPVLDPSATPPILDTDDVEIGIMRQWPIAGQVWGRYEVWKQWDADPDPARLEWRQKVNVEDNSVKRLIQKGSGWQLRSIGYVFARRDASKAYNEQPNYVIAVETLETEIRRLALRPPGPAAINVSDGNRLTVNTKGRVYGGNGAGVYYPENTGTPVSGPASAQRITGSPALAPVSSYDDSVEAVFGVSRNELFAMANSIVTNMAAFPSPVAKYSIIVVKRPSVKFDSSTPLSSSGPVIVFIEGNTTLLPGNLSNFTGLLYVDGNLTVREPCDIKGSIVVTGNMTVQGASDFADIYYDEEALNELRLNIGNYRMSSGFRKPIIR